MVVVVFGQSVQLTLDALPQQLDLLVPGFVLIAEAVGEAANLAVDLLGEGTEERLDRDRLCLAALDQRGDAEVDPLAQCLGKGFHVCETLPRQLANPAVEMLVERLEAGLEV